MFISYMSIYVIDQRNFDVDAVRCDIDAFDGPTINIEF